jgi:enterochelin esterase-like enzyme
MQQLLSVAITASVGGCASSRPVGAPSPSRFAVTEAFASQHVAARKVVVWLPSGYDSSDTRYAVLYMHDGQNLFDPATSMAGQPWAVDQALSKLIAEKKVRNTIVVGIANSPARWREYVPEQPVNLMSRELRSVISDPPTTPLSENYLKFLVEEVKPYVDKNFRTLPNRANTFVMGSSMGGLISLYALARYPETFGGAGCVSTHWPITSNAKLLAPALDARVPEIANHYVDWLRANLPRAGSHRIYFDHGTINLDSLYPPLQAKADAVMREKGYRTDVDWMTRAFDGADHNEPAWRARLHIPLTFLLAP